MLYLVEDEWKMWKIVPLNGDFRVHSHTECSVLLPCFQQNTAVIIKS